ncbi:MAG: NUDIX hydrolase [Peptoniphilaceae bacterium]|uniref:NUDIX hydrolase n=1 Tax=Parvimonas sp. TaxID=1944660 RepID=UPI0025DA1A14|nr:NUDIX hydrolase [Parvimonas sp.]MCI5997578.1 NUDIX hydrolase [Parvimonas sp.]MDD7765173.1 NUDIX hydrolase [Peptoniphilaceae bacterium]MDY3051210.1 NUDIX hydrolase [Parvimonas sp.]
MYKKIKEENIYSGKIINVKTESFEVDNKIIKRELVEHKDAVGIFPIDDEGFVYLVKQYRTPIKDFVIEIPAGLVEDSEDYENTALRELQEEIGYGAKVFEKIFQGYNSIGFCTEKTVIYRASELYVSKLPEDEDEDIEILKIHFNELKKMYLQGEIVDFKTAVAILNEIGRR